MKSSQRANTVEAQVRKVKNAARAAILENPLTNHSEWHHLYPLVIVRLNTMLSKYGASRELVHFQDVLHTHIPLITDIIQVLILLGSLWFYLLIFFQAKY